MFMFAPITLFFIIIICTYIVEQKQYKKTEYYQQTKNSYRHVRFNKGLLGEFYIYKNLKSLTGYGRYLFNLYIPKNDRESTELDVVLLHESGIYVFESKNYSGWIFGTESQQYWTQVLPSGRGKSQKNKFYNPILQNSGHIKWLQTFLDDQTLQFYSYIIFSDRCTLKDITLTSEKHYIINRRNILNMVQQNIKKAGVQLSPDTIDTLFEKLYPLTQVGEAKKLEHIKNIQQKMHTDTETICPHCGGKLVIHTATKGKCKGKEFLGCSNYPKCKYIKNLQDE